MPALRIERIGPGATLQDLGRPGRMYMGVPPGGALVPELLAATNLAAGAVRNAAAIEIPLHGGRFRAVGDLSVAVDGVPTQLADGQRLDVAPARTAVRYMSMAGGVDVPVLLGGRGTLLSVGLGPAMLRAGDVLHTGSPTTAEVTEWTSPDPDAAIRVVPGPDVLTPRALDTLVGAVFCIGTAMDRTGVRLDGPRMVESMDDRRGSSPMVRGAIELTPDGVAIVLGPDHPTTGGYPVVAVVVRADLGALALRRPGTPVRFTPFTPRTAWPAG